MSSTPAVAGSETVTFEQARHGVNALPWRPYDALMPEDRLSVDDAAAVMSVGWKFANLPAVALRPPIAWKAIAAGNRTWAFRLHSWDALGPVLSSYEATREQQYLEFALSVALDWIEQHPSRGIDPESAWYDMAVALRAYRLAYLVDVSRPRTHCHACPDRSAPGLGARAPGGALRRCLVRRAQQPRVLPGRRSAGARGTAQRPRRH